MTGRISNKFDKNHLLRIPMTVCLHPQERDQEVKKGELPVDTHSLGTSRGRMRDSEKRNHSTDNCGLQFCTARPGTQATTQSCDDYGSSCHTLQKAEASHF